MQSEEWSTHREAEIQESGDTWWKAFDDELNSMGGNVHNHMRNVTLTEGFGDASPKKNYRPQFARPSLDEIENTFEFIKGE